MPRSTVATVIAYVDGSNLYHGLHDKYRRRYLRAARRSPSIPLMGLWHVVAVPPLVVLTGCPACDLKAIGDLRPADAESCGVVGEHAQFGVQFLPLESCPADPLQYVGLGSRAILSEGLGGAEALTR
jgi:hypothetical protein